MSIDEIMNDLQTPWQEHPKPAENGSIIAKIGTNDGDRTTDDLISVVRCKDCIHHHYERGYIPYCDQIDYGYGWNDDEFCSRGERRDATE